MKAGFVLLAVVCCATVASAAGGASSLASSRRLRQSVSYVQPQNCQYVIVSTQASASGRTISGSVTIQNGKDVDLAFSSVQVALYNNVPVAPIYTAASCPTNTVPMDPTPGAYGSITCTFTAQLPSSGPAASPSAWTSASAKVALTPGSATCSSPTVAIAHSSPPPSSTCPAPIHVTAALSADGSTVTGTVTFFNGGYSNIGLGPITYQLNNDVPVAPLYGAVVCPSSIVPWSPVNGQYGTLTCSFSASIAANSLPPTDWTTVLVKTATSAGNSCPAASANVDQSAYSGGVAPVLYGK